MRKPPGAVPTTAGAWLLFKKKKKERLCLYKGRRQTCWRCQYFPWTLGGQLGGASRLWKCSTRCIHIFIHLNSASPLQQHTGPNDTVTGRVLYFIFRRLYRTKRLLIHYLSYGFVTVFCIFFWPHTYAYICIYTYIYIYKYI